MAVVVAATILLLAAAPAPTVQAAPKSSAPNGSTATWSGAGTTLVDSTYTLNTAKCGVSNGGDSDDPYVVFLLASTKTLTSPTIRFGASDTPRAMTRTTGGYRYLYKPGTAIDLGALRTLPVTAAWVGAKGLTLSVSHGCVGPLVKSGGLYGFGYNYEGEAGVGSAEVIVSTVTRSGTDATWQHVAVGIYQSAAVKVDGTLWGWGYGGVTGDGTAVNRTSPVQIGTATDWAEVFAGAGYTTFAVKKDGTLWGWGYNGNGQLGNGTDVDALAPVQIGTATDWAMVAPGWTHTVALKTDGALWAWGYNGSGQLGDGTDADSLVPVRIGTATWTHVSAGWDHTLAVKSDGTLWAWGYEEYGRLGNGAAEHEPVPVQIGSATTWKTVSANWWHSAGTRTDGTLWTWGYNGSGQLGVGTDVDSDVPARVGTATTWDTVVVGDYHTVALRTDGTAWAWGDSSYGQVGDGDTCCTHDAPRQIDQSTGWVAVGAGTGLTIGIRTP